VPTGHIRSPGDIVPQTEALGPILL